MQSDWIFNKIHSCCLISLYTVLCQYCSWGRNYRPVPYLESKILRRLEPTVVRLSQYYWEAKWRNQRILPPKYTSVSTQFRRNKAQKIQMKLRSAPSICSNLHQWTLPLSSLSADKCLPCLSHIELAVQTIPSSLQLLSNSPLPLQFRK